MPAPHSPDDDSFEFEPVASDSDSHLFDFTRPEEREVRPRARKARFRMEPDEDDHPLGASELDEAKTLNVESDEFVFEAAEAEAAELESPPNNENLTVDARESAATLIVDGDDLDLHFGSEAELDLEIPNFATEDGSNSVAAEAGHPDPNSGAPSTGQDGVDPNDFVTHTLDASLYDSLHLEEDEAFQAEPVDEFAVRLDEATDASLLVDQLRTQLTQQQHENQRLQHRLSDQEARYLEKTESIRELLELRDEQQSALQEKSSSLEQLRSEANELRQKLEAQAEQEEARAELQQELQRVQTQLEEARSQIAGHSQEMEKRDQAQSTEKAEWSKRLETAERQLADSGTQLELAQSELSDVRQQLDARERKLSDAGQEIESLSTQLKELADSQERLGQLESEIQQAEQQRRESDARLAEQQRELEDARHQAETARQSQESHQESYKQLQVDLETRSLRVATLKELNQELQDKLNRTDGEQQAAIEPLESRIRELEEQLNVAPADGDEDSDWKERFEKRLKKEYRKRKRAEQELSEAEEQRGQLARLLKAARDELAEMQSSDPIPVAEERPQAECSEELE